MTEDEGGRARRLVEALVAKLTPPQREFLCLLPMDGGWLEGGHQGIERRHGPNSLRGFGKSGLIEGYYQETTRHRLTELGQMVRAHIATLTGAGNG